ncbi:MAG: energy-coupling factor transporter ATPase [Christensenellaceae bacterium]|jgi:energy-coupling factor transport system ATP-binding protein
MDAVYAQNVKYAYESEDDLRLALAGVSLTIKKGEFVAILGHNGSGKSTFAKNINVLLVPQEGELKVMGMDTFDEANTWEIRRQAGMVFQNPDNQIVSTVVEEDVAFGPENLGVPREEILERIHESLAAVDMLGFEKRAPHMLSGGQKQRVAIAGILAMHPELIVFDEPTAMLDPSGRNEVMDTIHALSKEHGKTIVLITHYMEEAIHADRVFLFNKGKVTLEGTPEEVFTNKGKIEEAGLMPPFATRVYEILKERGVELSGRSLTIDELVEELCRLK